MHRRLALSLVLVMASSWRWRAAARPPVPRAAALRSVRRARPVAGAEEAQYRRHAHARDRASRRREQRDAGVVRAQSRDAGGAGVGDPGGRRTERDRARSCSTRWGSCGPKSCSRPTSSTARSSTSRARWISATRSAPRKPTRSGGGRRSSAISSGISGRCGPTSWSRSAPKAPAVASTTRRRRVIAAEAYQAAADPTKFPEQIKAGLRPWQVRKLYRVAGGPGGRGRGGPGRGGPGGAGGRGAASRRSASRGPDGSRCGTGRIRRRSTPRWTPTSSSRCSAARSAKWAASRPGMHMCQGRAPLVPPPAASAARYRLVETVLAGQRDKDETSLFEGIDTSLMGLTRFAGARQSDALVRGLAVASAHVARGDSGARHRRCRRRRCSRWSTACRRSGSCART